MKGLNIFILPSSFINPRTRQEYYAVIYINTCKINFTDCNRLQQTRIYSNFYLVIFILKRVLNECVYMLPKDNTSIYIKHSNLNLFFSQDHLNF